MDRVGDPVAVKVDQPHLWVVQPEAGLLAVGAEPVAVPFAVVLQRVVADPRAGADHQVDPAVAVGVQQLHPGLGEGVRRRFAHRSRQVQAAVAKVGPHLHRLVHLQDVGQAVAAQIHQLVVGAGQRARRQVRAGDRDEVVFCLRPERAVSERQRGHFLAGAVVAVPSKTQPAQQRGPVERPLLGQVVALVQVLKGVAANQARPPAVMDVHIDPGAALPEWEIGKPARRSTIGSGRSV